MWWGVCSILLCVWVYLYSWDINGCNYGYCFCFIYLFGKVFLGKLELLLYNCLDFWFKEFFIEYYVYDFISYDRFFCYSLW